MSSEEGPAVGPRLHRLTPWFDPESAAVMTILLGLFQVMLSVLLFHANKTLPNLFILPLVLGIFIVAGGSFTMATERNPSKALLQRCACSNVVCLVGAVLAFVLYFYGLSAVTNEPCVAFQPPAYDYRRSHFQCPKEVLEAYSWSVVLLLLLYDGSAVVMHCLLSVSAIKALKSN